MQMVQHSKSITLGLKADQLLGFPWILRYWPKTTLAICYFTGNIIGQPQQAKARREGFIHGVLQKQNQVDSDSVIWTHGRSWQVLPLFFCLSTLLSPEDRKFPWHSSAVSVAAVGFPEGQEQNRRQKTGKRLTRKAKIAVMPKKERSQVLKEMSIYNAQFLTSQLNLCSWRQSYYPQHDLEQVTQFYYFPLHLHEQLSKIQCLGRIG